MVQLLSLLCTSLTLNRLVLISPPRSMCARRNCNRELAISIRTSNITDNITSIIRTTIAGSFRSFSFASPPPSDSSLLRHPHDPRLLQAQYQAAASSFGLLLDPNFPPIIGDLVPIELQGLAPTNIPQEVPFVGFSPLGPAGSAPPFLHAGEDPDFNHHHRQPGVLQYPGAFPIPFMQDPELSILNAESFDDGVPGFRAPRSLPPGRTRAIAAGEPSRSRKRSKAQSSDGGEPEEEEKKRSRGRPRLDPNDETAKDRRRTQIRLAQRAYRNRKETAIQTLEKKVDELKSNNEEMSNAFMRLYDYAVTKGMLETAPEFGRQLQATTEKFVALARKSSEDVAKDGEMAGGQDAEAEIRAASPDSTGKPSERSGSPVISKADHDQVMYGGYVVDTQPLDIQPTPRSHAMSAVHTTSWAHGSQALEARTLASQAPLGYEIVTEPTPDNASFPFGMSLENGMDASGTFDSMGQPFIGSPYSLLSGPSSYAYQERTFGRRLQRSTWERALLFMRTPNPPPHIMAASFGFCLLFESKDKITERLANRLSVNNRETLFEWKFPFLHLGGGGTWFEELHSNGNNNNNTNNNAVGGGSKPRRLVGNQGSLEPGRQKVDSLYGIGPWDAATEHVRDVRLDQKLHMSVPGFEGAWYDPDEVEWVLQSRGVAIPPAADFVTAEIDPTDFPLGPTMDTYAANTLVESSFDLNTVGTGAEHVPPRVPAASYGGQQPASMSPSEDSVHLDPRLGGDVFGMGSAPTSHTSSSGAPMKRLVTVNVGMLIHDLFASDERRESARMT
ncbi:AP-1-like transcription factor YAP1 [Colletotrichum spinosum]|uniref:AP-1-like transcription factor YAP1 n=1 Tax=Colletotrichum spinosum TaxID=1347390 RepID=A0A4R8QW72_9PEZI|nr:AP-1-like transcription factor YAP1 [Colletotrichum spinosum]